MNAWLLAGALLLALAAAGLLWFMRDPERQPPAEPGAILAPADGRVLRAERVEQVEQAAALGFIAGPAWRIVIFLSLWDVHVQRAPAAGLVELSERQGGGFAPAFTAAAAHNAGHRLGLQTAGGPMLVVRTVGVLARRVTTQVAPGQALRAGERIGRMLLGSRAEVFLPASARVRVARGQHVTAGETVIAVWAGAANRADDGGA
jgi:phosphatidylserine decarboxylase